MRERLDAVLRHQDPQLVACINAPGLCASFNERGFGVLIPAEKKVFAQPLRMDLDPRNAFGLQQGEECRFKFTQLPREILGKQPVGADSQLIATVSLALPESLVLVAE